MSRVVRLLESLNVNNHVSLSDVYELSYHELLVASLSLNISIYSLIKKMSMNIDDLIQKVKDQKTVEDSAVALLTHLNEEVKAAVASGDTAKLQQLSDTIDANTKELSDAVASIAPAPVANPETVQG